MQWLVNLEEMMVKSRSRQTRYEDAKSEIEMAVSLVEELRDELQEWLDNMPENLQGGSKAEEIQEAIDELDPLVDLDVPDVTFPGMF